MNEDCANFPYEDLLQDALDEHRLKRFKQKVQTKKGDVDAFSRDS